MYVGLPVVQWSLECSVRFADQKVSKLIALHSCELSMHSPITRLWGGSSFALIVPWLRCSMDRASWQGLALGCVWLWPLLG